MSDYSLPENRLTPVKAIRTHCIDCCGGEMAEVRKCELTKCSLWPYRMGRNPAMAGRGNPSAFKDDSDSQDLS